jgi:hypothetical protein
MRHQASNSCRVVQLLLCHHTQGRSAGGVRRLASRIPSGGTLRQALRSRLPPSFCGPVGRNVQAERSADATRQASATRCGMRQLAMNTMAMDGPPPVSANAQRGAAFERQLHWGKCCTRIPLPRARVGITIWLWARNGGGACCNIRLLARNTPYQLVGLSLANRQKGAGDSHESVVRLRAVQVSAAEGADSGPGCGWPCCTLSRGARADGCGRHLVHIGTAKPAQQHRNTCSKPVFIDREWTVACRAGPIRTVHHLLLDSVDMALPIPCGRPSAACEDLAENGKRRNAVSILKPFARAYTSTSCQSCDGTGPVDAPSIELTCVRASVRAWHAHSSYGSSVAGDQVAQHTASSGGATDGAVLYYTATLPHTLRATRS